jgi:hypothetical protein
MYGDRAWLNRVFWTLTDSIKIGDAMAVELVNQPRCRVCQRVKNENNRWFLIKTANSEFSFRAYNEALLAEYDEAVCGMQCLEARLRSHAEKLIGMRNSTAYRRTEGNGDL